MRRWRSAGGLRGGGPRSCISSLTAPPQVPREDKSCAAIERRADLLELLLRSPRIDPRAVDAQGRTFLFAAAGWAAGSRDYRGLLRFAIELAHEAGVSVNCRVRCRAWSLARAALLRGLFACSEGCECPHAACCCPRAGWGWEHTAALPGGSRHQALGHQLRGMLRRFCRVRGGCQVRGAADDTAARFLSAARVLTALNSHCCLLQHP